MAFGMEVGLGPSHIMLDGDPASLPKKGTEPPIFGPLLLSPNGWMDQDGTWYGGKPQPRRLCVRWGPSFPSTKGAQSPQFSANVHCGQTTEWTKVALGMEVDLGPGDLVFDGDPATPRTEGTPTTTQFLAHVYCGQAAGWMKTPLGTEVDFGQGPRPHCIRRGPSSARKGHSSPHLFGPCLLWPRSPISATAELSLVE